MRDIISLLFISVLLIFIFFFTKNYNKLFLPSKKLTTYSVLPSEEVIISGVSISAFWIDSSNISAHKTILFCHGNYGNITQRNYMIKLCKTLNLNLILFDYYGYGKSIGYPSTHKIIKNSDIVFKWVSQKINPNDLIIWGESLGGSMAAYLSSKKQCSKLILCATFASLDDLGFGVDNSWYKTCAQYFFGFIMNLLPTESWVCQSTCPVLIIHSTEDEIIPIQHALKIKQNDPDRIKVIRITGGHSTPSININQMSEIISFIQNDKSKDLITQTIDYENQPLQDLAPICINHFNDIINQEW